MAQKVEKNHRIHFNIGTIIFLVIVLYMAAIMVRDMGRHKLAVYEVDESIIDDEMKSTGVVLREERLLTTEQEGYINHYIKDGSRVKKGGSLYFVDKSGRITSWLHDMAEKKEGASRGDEAQIYEDLRALSAGFSGDVFYRVYETRNTLTYDMLAYSDTLIAQNRDKLKDKFGEDSYVEAKSPEAGFVSCYSDGLERLNLDSLDQSALERNSKMEDLRTTDQAKAGTPVYRLITSQKWQLAFPVSKDEYERLKRMNQENITSVPVTFTRDNFTTEAQVEGRKKADGYYIVLHFNDYMQRYANQRYLSVRILLSETRGLKIPVSSLVEKEVYKIPERFLTNGSGSSTGNRVNVMTVNRKGEKELHQKKVTVYREDGEGYAYISKDTLKKGDILASQDKTDRFTLLGPVSLQGVFLVNRGYAIFKPITISSRNEDYCIISPKESSIELYDRIILDSKSIKENDVIY